MTDEELRALSDAELKALKGQLDDETYRRAGIDAAREQVSSANATILESEGLKPGDPWRQAAVAAEAYPLAWVASHQGQVWVANVDGTMQEPGTGDDWSVVEPEQVAAKIEASPTKVSA